MTAKLDFPKYVPESVRMEARRLLQAFPAGPYSATIKSLISRPEMQECYAELKKFADENMMATYLYAAVAGQNNFDRYRVQQEQAKKLRNKVAKSAIELANLLDKASALGMGASEFMNVRELLRKTTPSNNINAAHWTNGCHEVALNSDGYAWSKAPYLTDCLREVARRANEKDVSLQIDVCLPPNLLYATSTRKKNAEWSYLRNLWVLLRESGFKQSFPLAKAISCTGLALDLECNLDAPNIYAILVD
jgi:hypothetical protein